MKSDPDLPQVLAGPLLRHAHSDRLLLWLVTSRTTTWRFRLHCTDSPFQERVLTSEEQTELPIGKHAFIQLLDIRADTPWPTDCVLHYDLAFEDKSGWQWISHWAPHLCHEGQRSPHVVIKSHIDRILHGSCRKPHHPAVDGLTNPHDHQGLWIGKR